MLHLNTALFTVVVKQARQQVATSQPAWAAAIGQAAELLVHHRRCITALDDQRLYLTYSRRGPYTATPETCTCKQFRFTRVCEHRLMAWLYQRYCEALAAHALRGAAD